MRMRRGAVAVVIAIACGAARSHADAPRAAVFPFDLDDTSLIGEMAPNAHPDRDRLAHLDAQLRDALAASGRYTLVPLGPAAQAAETRHLWNCDGCEVDVAKQAGAQVSVVGWVQKVSNLILNINLVIRDVATGKRVAAGSVDIRGDTDESWTRGLAYLLRNRILVSDVEPAH